MCVQALMKVSKSLTWHGEPSPGGSLALWGLGLLACCEGLQEQLLLAGELHQQAWQPYSGQVAGTEFLPRQRDGSRHLTTAPVPRLLIETRQLSTYCAPWDQLHAAQQSSPF